MGLLDGIKNTFDEWYREQRGVEEATNLTAVKVNIEQARTALTKLSALMDEMEEAYTSANGNIRRCHAGVREGLEGESKSVLCEEIDQWRMDQIHLCMGVRNIIDRTSARLEGLVESDQALANYIENS